MRFPITRTSYLLHKSTPRNISGLVVELSLKDKTDDTAKAEFVLSTTKKAKNVVDANNPSRVIKYEHESFEQEFVSNYDWFMNLAANYGFLVNKNAPWVLVADITSEEMQKYAERFRMKSATDSLEPGTASEYFDKFCSKTYLDDAQSFIDFMVTLYRDFLDVYPYIVKPKYFQGCNMTIPTKEPREPLTAHSSGVASVIGYEDFYVRYPMEFWLPILLRVQMYEQNISFETWSEKFKKTLENRVSSAYNKGGLLVAQRELNLIVKTHSYTLQNHMPTDHDTSRPLTLSDFYAIQKRKDNERRKDFSAY